MRRELPEINAGSMADIAFLLLIFFLVTTTLKVDQGIMSKLPRKNKDAIVDIKAKNLLEVIINSNNELFVEDKRIEISELKNIAIAFIDNGGGTDHKGNRCDWCQGRQDPTSSDHPSKALIGVQSNRSAHYETYVKVLDNLHQAYTELRNRFAMSTYQMSYSDLVKEEKRNDKDNLAIREKIKNIQQKYPHLISDSEFQN